MKLMINKGNAMEDSRKVVTFLDLLGFSEIMKTHPEYSRQKLNQLSCYIHDKFRDGEKRRSNKTDDEEERLRETDITYFENLIYFSDSLIISADEEHVKLFICQLGNFIANWVKSELKCVTEQDNKTPPLLFRGGIAIGDVIFNSEQTISDGQYNLLGTTNVSGMSYVDAVHLESAGKGPRLFCNEAVAKLLKDLPMLKPVKENVYEIIWTYYACEQFEYYKGSTVTEVDEQCGTKTIQDTIDYFLIPALNLYNAYWKEEGVAKHYWEFIRLIFQGLSLYINEKLNSKGTTQLYFNYIQRQIDNYWKARVKNLLRASQKESFSELK